MITEILEELIDKINSKLLPITHAIYTVLFILIMYSAKIDIVKFICKYALAINVIAMVLFIYEFILYGISANQVKNSDSPTTVNELIKKFAESKDKGASTKVDLTTSMYSELKDRAIFNILKLGIIIVSPLVLIIVKSYLANYSSIFYEIVGWLTLIVYVYLIFSAIHSVLSSTWIFIKCKNTVVKVEYIGKAKKSSDKKEDKKDEK